MCGIAGFIDFNKKSNYEILKNMTDLLYHRGPDDGGYSFYSLNNCNIGLGHRRLSILDLSSQGHQPMKFDNLEIIYNGEVYNFKEIRTKLEKYGYTFESNSDTEVILKAYHKWGVKFLEKLDGMFAFSIYDRNSNKLLIFRDRLGVKPLYYYFNNSLFMFSSELKSFHQNPFFCKEIDEESLSLYFQYGYILEPWSIFKNVYKLKAGHYLEIDLNKKQLSIQKYWDVSNTDKFLDMNENEILNKIEKYLIEAFNYRMVSDVNIGVFLSGGIDSSIVTAILSNKYKLNTYTIGFNEKDIDESKYARKVAKFLNTNHTEYICSLKEAQDIIPLLPEIYDEPFGDSSTISTFLVSKIAKKDVKVVLSADGGDEIFAGYDKYSMIMNYYNKFSILKKMKFIFNFFPLKILNSLYNYETRFYKIRNIATNFSLNTINKMMSQVFSFEETLKILNIEFLKKTTNLDLELGNKDILNNILLFDLKSYLVDDILVKVDRATMANSIEGREPMLNYKLIEFMQQVPSSIKYKNGDKKYLLKQIAYKYIPKELIDRKKMGFGTPVDRWLYNDLKLLVEYYLSEDKLDNSIFNVNKVLEIKRRFYNQKESSKKIWLILIFQIWYERWM